MQDYGRARLMYYVVLIAWQRTLDRTVPRVKSINAKMLMSASTPLNVT